MKQLLLSAIIAVSDPATGSLRIEFTPRALEEPVLLCVRREGKLTCLGYHEALEAGAEAEKQARKKAAAEGRHML